MASKSGPFCVATVRDFTGFHSSPCGRTASFHENGKDYCGLHAPSRKAERAKKRGPSLFERECSARAKHQADYAALVARAERAEAEVARVTADRRGVAERAAVLAIHDAMGDTSGYWGGCSTDADREAWAQGYAARAVAAATKPAEGGEGGK